MFPSHCNMSVSAYGMSLFRELGRVGRMTEQMKMWGSLAERSQAKTQGYGKRVNMAVLLPHTCPCEELPRHLVSTRATHAVHCTGCP